MEYGEGLLRGNSSERDAGQRVAALYAEHGGAAYAFAYHMSGSREDAEDLVQIAFLAAYRALVRREQLVNPRAWLLTTVKRQALNLRRDRHELAASDRIETLAGVDAAGWNSEVRVAQVRASLWALPEQQHQAFVLRHWSGLSHAEIASVMDTSVAAVESLLVRARAAVIAERDMDGACLAVRERLCADRPLSPPHHRHLGMCRRCAVARTRLDRVAGVAAAVALVPRVHVAQALAAAVPGFTVHAAVGAGAGAGASGVVAAGAGKTGLLVKGAIAVVTLAGAAGVAHTHGLPLPGVSHSHVAHLASGQRLASHPLAGPIDLSRDATTTTSDGGAAAPASAGGAGTGGRHDTASGDGAGGSDGTGGTTTTTSTHGGGDAAGGGGDSGSDGQGSDGVSGSTDSSGNSDSSGSDATVSPDSGQAGQDSQASAPSTSSDSSSGD
jgi:RNA polymerase sigma factor (sigma-70 family)